MSEFFSIIYGLSRVVLSTRVTLNRNWYVCIDGFSGSSDVRRVNDDLFWSGIILNCFEKLSQLPMTETS